MKVSVLGLPVDYGDRTKSKDRVSAMTKSTLQKEEKRENKQVGK
jgi:hypothetical protein